MNESENELGEAYERPQSGPAFPEISSFDWKHGPFIDQVVIDYVVIPFGVLAVHTSEQAEE
jgi:hypothetical protein